MFQCTQRRKDRRFVCVVCHTKQSVVRIFGVSARAADIRALVQKYNMAGATAAASNGSVPGSDSEPEPDEEEEQDEEEQEPVDKWAPFLVEERRTPDAAEDPVGGLAGRLAAAAERRERAAGGGGPSREPAARARVVRSNSRRRRGGAAEPYTAPSGCDSDFEALPASPPHAPAAAAPPSTSKWARFL